MKTHISAILAAPLLAALAACASAPSQPRLDANTSRASDAETSRQLRKALNDYVSRTPHSGGAVLVARDGKVLLSEGYGPANVDLGVPNTSTTRFRIASLTKAFTATAILQLEERGKLSIDESICRYLPECASHWAPVKVSDLLTHTGGIPDKQLGIPYRLKESRWPITPEQLVALFHDTPLAFAPGTKHSYSNSGYILLGVIIEHVTSKEYGAALDELIFKPAGMKDSGYEHSEQILERRASGYTMNSGPLTHAPYIEPSWLFSAGGLYSTVEDLKRFDDALYDGKLLSQKTLERMWEPRGPGTRPDGEGYGLGWQSRHFGRHRFVGHNGAIIGFGTEFRRFVDDHTTVILLSNLPAGFEELLDSLQSIALTP